METALQVLLQQAKGEIHHRYDGLCPDNIEGYATRDPECQVCRAIDTVEEECRALTTLRESITLAAAPLGITGEPGEVVGKMGDEAKRLRGIVTALEDGCYKCQHPVRVRELTCQKNALQQVVSERDEEIASLRAQLLTAREQGRREMREEAAKSVEAEAQAIRDANTYRGKVNQLAGEAAGWMDRAAANIRAIKEG